MANQRGQRNNGNEYRQLVSAPLLDGQSEIDGMLALGDYDEGSTQADAHLFDAINPANNIPGILLVPVTAQDVEQGSRRTVIRAEHLTRGGWCR